MACGPTPAELARNMLFLNVVAVSSGCFTAIHCCLQGLHASVTTIDAELVGLDRQQRVAVLSTGQQLRYSLLLLTAGLQDQTLARIAAGDEAEDAPVASAQDLAELTAEVSKRAFKMCTSGRVAPARTPQPSSSATLCRPFSCSQLIFHTSCRKQPRWAAS